MSEPVGEPAAGQGSEYDRNAQQGKDDAYQRVIQSPFLTQINRDERVDNGVRQLIETPGSGKGNAFILPQIIDKLNKRIHINFNP